VARIVGWDEYSLDLRRAAVTLAVVAAHVALVVVMLRSGGHSADVVDITFISLPISPEDRPSRVTPLAVVPRRASVVGIPSLTARLREPVHVQKPPISQASARRAATAREAATEQRAKPSRGETETRGDTVATQAGADIEPARPIDWHAEIEIVARAVGRHDNIDSGRRSLTGPKQPVLSSVPWKPVCPYERCEPHWGENPGIFDPSLHSKAGRIETIESDRTTLSDGGPRGESVLWINNRCYNILVSSDPQRQGMARCFFPLGKTAARGDLFDHMDASQLPQSNQSDTPWISYGLSVGAAPSRRAAH